MERHVEKGTRWALVTGATQGLGYCYACRLAEMGYDIVVAGIGADDLERTRKNIADAYGVRVEICEKDLAHPESGAELYAWVKVQHIDVEVLVNNAGMFSFLPITQTPIERIDKMLHLHAQTVTDTCRLFGADMAARGEGYILNMSSLAGWITFPGLAMYCATKAYIRSYSKCLSKELRPLGVRVTAVAPAGIATSLYGLTSRWQRIGVHVGALMTPEKCTRKALDAMFRGRAVYVPGALSRLLIPLVNCMPRCAEKLLSKYTKRFQK